MDGRLSLVLDRLVADHEARELPRVTPRRARLAELPGKADVVVGMRRSGKTFRLFQHLLELEARGVARARTLYVNFEDERLLPIDAAALDQIPEALYRRHPEVRDEEHWLLLDEVQNVSGWERFVRRLLDAGKTRFVITGSSAKLLSREIATSLRGRSLSTELLPFSFAEALAHAGVEIPARWPPASRSRSVLQHHFGRYLAVGGFPEVQTLADDLRLRVLQEYLDVVLFRDVVERHGIGNTTALRYLARRLVRSPASRFSIHRLYGDLRSQGVQVSKDLLHEYLAHLEDACLLFTVAVDSRSEKRKLVNPRKCYLVDHGLARAESFPQTEDLGHHLENIVYLELRRRDGELAYHLTDSGNEVDFVVRRGGEATDLIQVCASFSEPETRRRELRALEEGLRETGAPGATVVTLEEEDSLRLAQRPVRVVPAWRWLLES